MGGGSKKNKRGSIPSSSSSSSSDAISQASTKNELRERTEENDYGIMSDPDENTSPIPLLTKDVEGEQIPVPVEEIDTEEAVAVATTTDDYYTQSYTPSEQPQTQHLLQPSSPSSPQQDQPIQPLIQPPKSQNQSLETLQLRLSTDKNFSKKITLHTFFSYVILAIELQRAATATATATISVNEVETLIEHMIENHSASEEIRTYLRTLHTNGIITNMILAVIDFNTEENESLDKLFQHEQIELEEMNTLQDVTNTTTNSGRAIVENTATTTTTTPPPSRSGFFKRMRRFFSGCCG
jgi:hypothetical protein